MSLFRTAIVLSVGVMLLPTDERRQAELTGAVGAAVERGMTFCERNPAACAAGHEVWTTFLRKAEYGVSLASRIARDQMSAQPGTPDAFRSERTAIEPAPASESNRPTASSPRRSTSDGDVIQPARRTLSRADAAPQWAGATPDRQPR